MLKNYYQILSVDENSNIDEIKRSYRRLSIKYHPDKNNNNDKQFKQLTHAYQSILDNLNHQIIVNNEINKHNNLTKIVEVVDEWVIQQKRID